MADGPKNPHLHAGCSDCKVIQCLRSARNVSGSEARDLVGPPSLRISHCKIMTYLPHPTRTVGELLEARMAAAAVMSGLGPVTGARSDSDVVRFLPEAETLALVGPSQTKRLQSD